MKKKNVHRAAYNFAWDCGKATCDLYYFGHKDFEGLKEEKKMFKGAMKELLQIKAKLKKTLAQAEEVEILMRRYEVSLQAKKK